MSETWFCAGCTEKQSIPFWEEKNRFLSCFGRCHEHIEEREAVQGKPLKNPVR
jgi:hypothetical protein